MSGFTFGLVVMAASVAGAAPLFAVVYAACRWIG